MKSTGKRKVNTVCAELNWSDYLTLLPTQEVLKAKLHRSIEIARQRFALGDREEEV